MSNFARNFLKKIFKTNDEKIVRKLQKEADKINSLEAAISLLTDQELQEKTTYFIHELKNGKKLENIMHEAFAVVREASKRVVGMRHFDEQLIGGMLLHQGIVTEMRTGEGKTLVATLPSYLNALSGLGVHVVTVNDYLATRDAEWMGQIHKFLGLTVGCITSESTEDERRRAYNSHITYATNNELGFDFLRDNMQFHFEAKVQREFHYAIVDEIDSILIDEARTPLIISGPVDDNTDLYSVIDKLIRKLSAKDYEKDEKIRSVHLTEDGINTVESLLISNDLIRPGSSLYDLDNMQLVHYINQSLRSHILFSRDVDYLVKDKKVMLIDEFTGRVMDGRRYSEGLHQALEAKEGVPIQQENQTLASITFQNYFRMYHKLAGMTGTAKTEEIELKEIYNLNVLSVPTHRPVKRTDFEDEVYGTKKDKYNAIIASVEECYNKGQPVLVGTVSIEKSEELSKLLKVKKLPHNILNAKYHEQEAMIIAQAGRFKAITIATNMAGRGTDIMLGGNAEMLIKQLPDSIVDEKYQEKVENIKNKIELEKQQVIEAGGLFVIGTERHESRRIDNQLRGRSGRQGDPGSTKFFLSLDDDLMRIFASDRIATILRKIGLKDGEAIHHPLISRSLEKAQQKIERQNYEIRKNLLKYDDVMNEQRRIIYSQRTEILESENATKMLHSMIEQLVEEVVQRFIPENSYKEEWDLEGLTQEFNQLCSLAIVKENLLKEQDGAISVTNYLVSELMRCYEEKKQSYGEEVLNSAVKYIVINTLDQVWKEHLHELDHVRQGISLRAYGQKDPLIEYKREAFMLFEKMLYNFKYLVVQRFSHLKIDMDQFQEVQTINESFSRKSDKIHNQDDSYVMNHKKVPRNSPCPCGSGKKYKHCHGSV